MQLLHNRAKGAEVYPAAFCDAIIKGVAVAKEHMVQMCGVTGEMVELMALEEDETMWRPIVSENLMGVDMDEQMVDVKEDIYEGWWFVDDLSGEVLDPNLVKAARQEEMKGVKDMKVYVYFEKDKV